MTATRVSAAASTTTTLAASRSALVITGGAIVIVAANTIIAFSALAAGAHASFAPLGIAVFAPFSIVAFLAAYVGWRIVRARSRRPAAVLTVLVPVLTVVSFVPDTVLAITGFIPGASLTGVIALALMHLVVVGSIVPIASRIAPVR